MSRDSFGWRSVWLLSSLVALIHCADSEVAPADCPDGSQPQSGRCVKQCVEAADCLVNQDCIAGLCQAPPPGSPRVLVFGVVPLTVESGETVRISYSVANADSVVVTVTEANGDASVIVSSTDDFTGIATTSLMSDARLELVARKGDMVATASQEVEVTGDEPLAITSFDATPNVVNPGQTTTLSWTVDNGVGRVRISTLADNRVVVANGLLNGTFDTTVEASTIFVLSVQGRGGQRAQAQAQVSVRRPPPSIVEFEALPTAVGSGDGAVLSWRVENADRISLRVEDSAGSELYRSRVAPFVEYGRFLVAPTDSTTYVLEAGTFEGLAVSERTEVAVEPEVLTLDVEPDFFREQGDESILSWEIAPPDAEATLTIGGDAFPAATTGELEFSTPTGRTVKVEILAEAGAGEAKASTRLWKLEPEGDRDNNRPDDAIQTFGSAIEGESAAAGIIDPDYFAFDVPPNGSVQAGFLKGVSCPRGVTLELLRAGMSLQTDTSNNTNCPLIRDVNLPSGRYHLRLQSTTLVPFRYRLGIAVDPVEPEYDYRAELLGTPVWSAPPETAVPLRWLPYVEDQTMPAGDEGFAVVELPFPFRYYGRTFAGVVVHTNGFVAFSSALRSPDSDPRSAWGPEPPNAIVAGFGADLVWPDAAPLSVWTDQDDDFGDVIWFDLSGAIVRGSGQPVGQVRVGLTRDHRVVLRYGSLKSAADFIGGIEGPDGAYRISVCAATRCEPGSRPQDITVVFNATDA